MRRYYFRFVFGSGRAAVAFTTSQADADKIRKHRWTTNVTTYFTPPLTRVRGKDGVPEEAATYRANLVHVQDMDSWTEEL